MKKLHLLILMMLGIAGFQAMAQDNACTGTGTDAAEGEFLLGYNYSFTTDGNTVNVTFELLDDRDGLVAFAQTFNPDFAEIPMTAVGDPADQTFGISFPDQTPGAIFNMRCKFAFAGGLSTTTIISYEVGVGCAETGGSDDALTLPITFEEDIDYGLADFGGNESEIVADPTDASNTVVMSTKGEVSEPWAGTTVAEGIGFAEPLPFAPGSTTMTVRVWSPLAGIPIRLKVENLTEPTISVETEATITEAEVWETLTFDFANEAGGTAALNFASVYTKASIFFNFGTPGGVTGAQTYYWDDVAFGEGGTEPPATGIELPITFEEDIDYGLADFGGNESEIVADPTDASNTVVMSTKGEASEPWAGTTVAEGIGFAEPLPFEAGSTTMTVRVWSPLAGIPIRLKVENLTNPAVSVETEATITEAEVWETLTFDFANQAEGTAAINFASVYTKASIFFNFGTPGGATGAQTYYWDDVAFGEGGTEPPATGIELPITFEEDIDYGLADFGGNESEIVADPTDASNTVVMSTKGEASEPWAGTTVAEGIGFAEPLPFEAGSTTMTVRVWSPLAGIPIRLKVENLTDPTVSVETEATITEAEVWETLTFDFANQAEGTAAINFASVYTKASIFFNFGTPGGATGAQTYYWDDVAFGDGGTEPPSEGLELPITFEEDIDYGLADFGGNESEIVADPTDASNTVVMSVKGAGAETWAGTTVGEGIGFAEPLPFEAGATTMTVRVWSPLADIPVRLKVEALNDPTVSVETEAIVTEAEVWQTLTFDFANEAGGTAAINFDSNYEKASIFFNFDVPGSVTGEQTYYWDDVTFGQPVVEPTTVFDIISGSEIHTTLASVLELTGLDAALSGEGPFTVFAPTDEAFANVPADVLAALLDDPDGDLTEVLLYHVLGAEVLSTDLSDGQEATTLQGEDITVSIEGTTVQINDATVILADLMADNGVVHVIGGVLLPPSFLVSTSNVNGDLGILVFPNPAVEFVQFSFAEANNAPVIVSIFDINGKLVKQSNFAGHDQRMSVGDLGVGTYLMRISQNGNHQMHKLMISK